MDELEYFLTQTKNLFDPDRFRYFLVGFILLLIK
jgi:hypothetical protein